MLELGRQCRLKICWPIGRAGSIPAPRTIKFFMNKLHLKNNPTLADFQSYVRRMVIERGFGKETVPELFMLLMEECGEFAKAARKHTGVKSADDSKEHQLAHEAADILVYLLDICNNYDIDLEQAFRDKEAINMQRTWS